MNEKVAATNAAVSARAPSTPNPKKANEVFAEIARETGTAARPSSSAATAGTQSEFRE